MLKTEVRDGQLNVRLVEVLKASDPVDPEYVWPVEVEAKERGHVVLQARGTQLDVYVRSVGNGRWLVSLPAIYRCGIVSDLTARAVHHALRLDSLADAASIAAAVRWEVAQ